MFIAMALPAVFTPAVYAKIGKIIIGVSAAIMIAALVLLGCRTAFIGLIMSGIILLNYWHPLARRIPAGKLTRIAALIFLVVAFTALGLILYQAKKNSADSRELIWKTSLKMVSKKPVLGYGYGSFERYYNLEQAESVAAGKFTTDELRIAGYTKMAYNEFIENAVEGGLPGLIFFSALLFSLLILPVFDYRESTGQPLSVVIAYSGLASFAVMSVVNFTVQAIPVMCLFTLYAAILCSHTPFVSGKFTLGIPVGRKLSAILLLSFGVLVAYSQVNEATAQLKNKQAVQYGATGRNAEGIRLLEPLSSTLKYSEAYWQNLGNLYYGARNFPAASQAYSQAKRLSTSPELYLKAGKCDERVGQFASAEMNYLIAGNIEPSRFLPKYSLMRLYVRARNKEYAIKMAKEIWNMKPKVSSAKVAIYKAQAYKLLHPGKPKSKAYKLVSFQVPVLANPDLNDSH